jgi:hypothetical protein
MAERQCSSEKRYRAIHATLSPAEERFERCRHTVGLFLGPCVAVLLAIMPMPSLTPKAHMLAHDFVGIHVLRGVGEQPRVLHRNDQHQLGRQRLEGSYEG